MKRPDKNCKHKYGMKINSNTAACIECGHSHTFTDRELDNMKRTAILSVMAWTMYKTGFLDRLTEEIKKLKDKDENR
jgi:hypothetical protein